MERRASSSDLNHEGMELQELLLCPFDFENFHVWKLRMESALALHDLLGLVTEKESETALKLSNPCAKSKAVAVKKQVQHEKYDAKARALILQTVQDMHLYIVRGSKTAKEAWDALCGAYERWAHKNWFALQHRLYELELREGESMHSHIQTFDTYVQHVSVKGEMDELTKAVILLRSVPHSYNIWVERQAREDKQAITLSYVVDNLLHLAEEQERERSDREHVNDAGSGGSPGRAGGRSFPKKMCFYCNSPGHLLRRCWKRIDDERNRAFNNYNAIEM